MSPGAIDGPLIHRDVQLDGDSGSARFKSELVADSAEGTTMLGSFGSSARRTAEECEKKES